MSNLFADGDSLIAQVFIGQCSASVEIWRDTDHITVSASRDRPRVEIEDGVGRIQSSNQAYLIKRTDYVFNGSACEPEVGDIIKDTVAGVVEVYRVSPSGRQACFETADSTGVLWRVFVTRSDTE